MVPFGTVSQAKRQKGIIHMGSQKRKMKRIFKWEREASSQGFMMIELVIAMALLLICLLGAAQMQSSSIRYNSMGRNLTSAIVCAQNVMEDIMTTPYDQVTLANFSPYPNTKAQEYSAFTITVGITDMGGSPPLWKNISVQVSGSGKNYTLNSTLSYPDYVLQ
jgi:Tfp pilus assembly protein PilV